MKIRHRFTFAAWAIAVVAGSIGYLQDRSIKAELSESILACQRKVGSHFADSAPSASDKPSQMITVTQSIMLDEVSTIVEFPMSMSTQEIRRALEVKFPGVRLPMVDSTEAPVLRDKNSLQAHFEFVGRDGSTYMLTAPAGSTEKEVISSAEAYYVEGCQPKSIDDAAGHKLSEQQREVQSVLNKSRSNRLAELCGGIAGLLVFLGALPLLWYFFLNRLSEVGGAIRGKKS